MKLRKVLTDDEIAVKCLTCDQGKWVHGQHICCRKVCKYRTTKTSSYYKNK